MNLEVSIEEYVTFVFSIFCNIVDSVFGKLSLKYEYSKRHV